MVEEVFCPHGIARLNCPECKPERDFEETPEGREGILMELDEDWPKTWRAWRLECHRRIRDLIEAVHERGFTDDLYYEIYDEPTVRGRNPSQAEDPSSPNGAFRLAFVKMFDATLGADRVEGYNAESSWDRFLEQTAKDSPEDLRERVAAGEILIHGGNGSWSHQQRPSHIWEHEALWDVIEMTCYGRERKPIDTLDDEEMVRRLEAAIQFADEADTSLTISLCSKLALIFDPDRWPVYNQRANSKVASRLGIEVQEPRNPERYVTYAKQLREFLEVEGLPDFEWLDIQFSRTYTDFKSRDRQDSGDDR